MRKLSLALPIILCACGTVHTNPTVDENNASVTVVPVTFANVKQANAVPYTPQSLPIAFKTTSNAGGESGPLQAYVPKPSDAVRVATSVPKDNVIEPYKIGVSDVILLATPAPTTEAEISGLIAAQNKRQGYTVQDDGAIAVPDVGRIKVADMTLEEAEDAVFNALVNKQIDPKFSLEIAEFNSQSVSVAGAVARPGLLPVSLNVLTLQEAIQLSGGVISDRPEFTVIRINRAGQIYQIPLDEMRSRPRLGKVKLKSGDEIFVDVDFKLTQAKAYAEEQAALSEARADARAEARASSAEARSNFLTQVDFGAVKREHAYLAGEVRNQGRFALPFDNIATVADALYSEGGIDAATGDPSQIYVIRIVDKAETPIAAYHINAADAVNILLATKMELRPDDVIFVSAQPVVSWNRVINGLLPTVTLAERATNN